MEKTERGKHEGGDAAWEEQRLGSYKRSEVRLVDIQEGLCNDIVVGQDQCHALAETNEHLIEEWWFKEQEDTAGKYANKISAFHFCLTKSRTTSSVDISRHFLMVVHRTITSLLSTEQIWSQL